MRLVDDELLAEIEALQMQRRYADELLQDLKAEREYCKVLQNSLDIDHLHQVQMELGECNKDNARLEARLKAVRPIAEEMINPECPENEATDCEICQAYIRWGKEILTALGGDDG